jgi:hypothetical protein
MKTVVTLRLITFAQACVISASQVFFVCPAICGILLISVDASIDANIPIPISIIIILIRIEKLLLL